MLCSFNYFGITDNAIDVNDMSKTRIDNIIENIEYYGYSGSRVKGLIFVTIYIMLKYYLKNLIIEVIEHLV